MPSDYLHLVEGLALQTPKRSITEIHRPVTAMALQKGWPALSYGRVYDIVQALDSGLVTLAHEGSRVYQELFDVLFLPEVSRPNECWQADLNIWLLNEKGKPQRPYLTVILDEYSRMVRGYLLSFAAPWIALELLILNEVFNRKKQIRDHFCFPRKDEGIYGRGKAVKTSKK